jgi:hypothetical protein
VQERRGDAGTEQVVNQSEAVGAGEKDHSVEIILDGETVVSPSRRRTGLQIRQLGNPERVDGFQTEEVDKNGKKIRTIRDDEEVELHKDERFRTVPSHGGPGGRTFRPR